MDKEEIQNVDTVVEEVATAEPTQTITTRRKEIYRC